MKTVMKKMFSLLLVAVLIVGIMPFQASAAEGCVTIHVSLNGNSCGSFTKDYPNAGNAPLSTWLAEAKTLLPENARNYATCPHFIGEQGEEIVADAAVVNGWVIYANFTSPYCSDCPAYDHNTNDQHCGSCGWGYGHRDDCTRNCDMGYDCAAANHKADCKHAKCGICLGDDHTGVCCSKCKVTGHRADHHCSYEDCGSLEHNSTDHCAVCGELACDGINHCTVCGQNGHIAALHCTVCEEYNCKADNHCAVCETKEHTTTQCPFCAICYANGDEDVTSHKASAHCSVCGVANGHTTGCKKNNAPAEPGKSKLHVYVNLYTANVETKTKLLHTYENLSEDTLVYSFIADRAEELEDLLPAGYEWSGNVYDADNDKTPVTMKAKVGTGTTVYINAYTSQDFVYIYVHNARSYENIRVIHLDGKKAGDSITRSEVVAAVGKYYSLNSLKMYDEHAWMKYIDGVDVEAVDTLTAESNITEIHVRISGSSKGTTYTADSTNPKTGDNIFAPVFVMGLSVSALAVLFYLNKKRAF